MPGTLWMLTMRATRGDGFGVYHYEDAPGSSKVNTDTKKVLRGDA